jgi:hypothetical protein
LYGVACRHNRMEARLMLDLALVNKQTTRSEPTGTSTLFKDKAVNDKQTDPERWAKLRTVSHII